MGNPEVDAIHQRSGSLVFQFCQFPIASFLGFKTKGPLRYPPQELFRDAIIRFCVNRDMLNNASHGAEAPLCRVRLDRFRFVVPFDGLSWKRPIPSVSGFTVLKDYEINEKHVNYRRVRSLANPKSGTQLFVQYRRTHGYLKPYRVTVIGCDETGILWSDLKAIGDAFSDFRIIMIELAFDFATGSGVDKQFVLRHGRFGKSRPAHNPKYPETLYYGTRHSAKFVRAYWKKEISAFRVELEMHSRNQSLPESDCLLYLLTVGPEDFRFENVNWRGLDSYLCSAHPRGKQIVAGCRLNNGSVHSLLQYLRSVHVNNPHRFLRTSERTASFETQ